LRPFHSQWVFGRGTSGPWGDHGLGHEAAAAEATDLRRVREVPPLDLIGGVGSGRTIARTADDDEFSSHNRSLAVADQLDEGIESPMSSAMVDFFAIMVIRRLVAMSVKSC